MKLPPLPHQATAFSLACERTAFAYFMEQGTGKTYCALAEAEHLFHQQRITALCVIAPNGVHRNWTDIESPKYLSVPHRILAWTSVNSRKFAERCAQMLDPTCGELVVVSFNAEAFSQKNSRAEGFARTIMRRHNTLLVIDESSIIKNPSAQRTKHLIRLGKEAPFRRIMTGTPVTQAPFNLFSQFRFLGENLLGFSSYTAFKAHYGVFVKKVLYQNGKRREFGELKTYQRLDQLAQSIAPHSFRITKKEAAPFLPDKTYVRRAVMLNEQQRSLYALARKDALEALECKDGTLTLTHALTRTLRLAQITGGFVKWDEDSAAIPVTATNPKIESLLQLVEELPEEAKCVIWARFVPELMAVHSALLAGGYNAELFMGELDQDSRMAALQRFREDPAVRFLVANPRIGKFGFTLTEASHVVYFSNDFSAETRWQSEDRVHRIGQALPVTIHDLVALDTIDERLLEELEARRDMADLFMNPNDTNVRERLKSLLGAAEEEL